VYLLTNHHWTKVDSFKSSHNLVDVRIFLKSLSRVFSANRIG
jgi:hypothetical protein